jgi:hypothetical protein
MYDDRNTVLKQYLSVGLCTALLLLSERKQDKWHVELKEWKANIKRSHLNEQIIVSMDLGSDFAGSPRY